MEMNLHGIEPTFLNWILVSGSGFYSYYNLRIIESDKERKN